jgi:glycosyltransferase involved in cell wall biosynthesis
MQVVLRPRRKNIFGQDYRSTQIINKLGLYPLDMTKAGYKTLVPVDQLELVVSLNADNPLECNFISRLPANIPVVVHFQLQWSYLDKKERNNAIKTFEKAHLVIVPARFLQNTIASVCSGVQTKLIHNGADIDIFHPSTSQQRQQYKAQIGIPSKSLLVCYVGRLTIAKGLQTLMKYVQLLKDPIHLLILCKRNAQNVDGAKKLRQLNNMHVHFDFNDENDNRSSHPVKYSDLLLTPSLSEVAPLVVHEALLAGVPVIGTFSTPFYTELEDLGIHTTYYQLIKLPPYVKGTERLNLVLREEDAIELSKELFRITRSTTPLNDKERKLLSSLTVKANLTSEKMLWQYQTAYAEAMMKN